MNDTVGMQVRGARYERQMSQVALADAAGCDHATISRLEAGKIRNPRMDLLSRLATALDRELVIRIAPMHPPRSTRRKRRHA